MKQQSCEVKAEPRVARKAFDFKTLQGYFEGLDNRALKRKDFSPKAPPSVADRAFEFKTLQGLFEEQGRASSLKRKVGTAVKKWPSSEERTASVPCVKDAQEMEESSDKNNNLSVELSLKLDVSFNLVCLVPRPFFTKGKNWSGELAYF